MNINYYDLFYLVFTNRGDKEIVNDEDKNNENDYNIYEDFIIPNHHSGIKPSETISR